MHEQLFSVFTLLYAAFATVFLVQTWSCFHLSSGKPRADINSPRRCRNRAAVQRSIQLRRQIPTLALTCSKKLKRHVLSHRTRVLCWAAGSGTVSTFCAAVFPWAMCLAAGRAAFSQTECNTKLKRMPPGLTWECLLATAWMYRLVTIKGTTSNKPGGREQL